MDNVVGADRAAAQYADAALTKHPGRRCESKAGIAMLLTAHIARARRHERKAVLPSRGRTISGTLVVADEVCRGKGRPELF